MANHGDSARKLHANGNSCSVSVYQAFRDVNTAGDGKAPKPRSEGGKCGAVLAAEKVLREMNLGDVSEFDDKFTETYGSLKCGELIKAHGRRCNEFVGFAADYVEERL
jgi:hypothetical protein